jgi:urease accessory protein
MNDWVTWQLADSAFPTGGFAHSNGLEAACQNGEVRSANDLAGWLEASLNQLGHGSLPFVTAFRDGQLSFEELDRVCDCFTLNHVANRASRLQGKALWTNAKKIFGLPHLDSGRNLRHCSNEEQLETKHSDPMSGEETTAATAAPFYHLAPTFGAVTRALDFGREPAARLFMFLHLRGVVVGAVRLGIVGPVQGQTLEHRFGARCEVLLTRFLNFTIDDLAQTAPLLEIWQGTQDRLYSRLFQS